MAGQRHQDDPWLVGRCLAGDEAAWGALVDRYTPLVYTIPARLGLAPDACDDVFQSVFLLLLKNLRAVRDHRSLAKWLMVTARRESIRIRSARERGGAIAEGWEGPVGDQWEPPLAELERLERRQRVWAAMERLEPRCRELLTALFAGAERPDYASVAARLGMPVGSIGPSRARCLGRLLDLLGEDCGVGF